MSQNFSQEYSLHQQQRNPFLNESNQYSNDGDVQYPTRPVDIRYTESVALDDGPQNGQSNSSTKRNNYENLDLIQEIMTDRVLLTSKLFYFLFYAAFGSLFPLMGVYFKQMGLNSVQSGMLIGVRPFIEIFSAPFWVRFADRFNKGKLLLMASIFSWIIFTSAMAYIRPPAAACVTFNESHYVLYTPYLDESDKNYEESLPKKRVKRSNNEAHEIVVQSDSLNGRSIVREKREISGRNKLPPKHVIGMSPIPIDYTLNYNKDLHASYVSPPFSTLVYKWEDIESVFLLLLLLVLLGELFSAPAITLADTVTLYNLGDKIDNYGRQRMFGSIGWAISMFFVGMALDSATSFRNHPCGPHESERNYKVCFTIFALLMLAAAFVAWQFVFPEPENMAQTLSNEVPMTKIDHIEPKSIFNTAAPINPPPGMHNEKKYEFLDKWKSAVFAQRTRELPEWMEVIKALNNVKYGAFLFVVWYMGVGIGLVFTFLFWHLQDIGGTPTLFGMASVINHISEIIAYFYSLQFIREYGHTKVLCFGLLCNFGRFLYISWLDNPYWVLPFEFLQGITTATIWAASCSYITQATPDHLKSSTQGVLQGLHHGFGRGCGAIFSGIFINRFGTRPVFAAYGIISALVLAGYVYINTQESVEGFRWFQDEGADHNVYIDESASGLAPHGVPSAPITKTPSKSNLSAHQVVKEAAAVDLSESSKKTYVSFNDQVDSYWGAN